MEIHDSADLPTEPGESHANPHRKTPLYARPIFHLLIIAVVGLIVYANTFHAPFVLDDELSIINNRVIKDLGKFLSGDGYRYNPRRFVGYLSIALNYRWGGLEVAGYHIFNLAVHLVTACLVYAMARLTLLTPYFGARGVNGRAEMAEEGLSARFLFLPLFAGLLFVAHPIQTQAVTYIIQRVASLAAMFYLLSLVLYIAARLRTEGKIPPVPPSQRGELPGAFLAEDRAPSLGDSVTPSHRDGRFLTLSCYLGALVSAGLAMKSKEISFTLPFVVALYEFTFFRMTLRKKIIFLLPVALTVLIVPISLLGARRSLGELIADVAEKTRVETAIPRLDYLFTQFRVIVTYLRLLIFPVDQNLDYDYPIYKSFLAPQVCLSFALLLGLVALAWFLYHRSRPAVLASATSPATLQAWRLIAFGILWFFVTLSVESSIIPIADVIFEHRLYLPSAGAFLALASLASLLPGGYRSRGIVAGACVIIAVLAVTTVLRNQVWSDPVALARDIVQKSPQKARPHYNLALVLQREGQLQEAFVEADVSSRLDPKAAKPHNILGVIYESRGMHDLAIAELSEAARREPEYPDAHANLADALSAAGRKEEALAEHFQALKLRPANAETYNKIGVIYGETGRMEQAVAFFRSASCLDPRNPSFVFNLERAQQLAQPGR